jgi:hypothetical protein
LTGVDKPVSGLAVMASISSGSSNGTMVSSGWPFDTTWLRFDATNCCTVLKIGAISEAVETL